MNKHLPVRLDKKIIKKDNRNSNDIYAANNKNKRVLKMKTLEKANKPFYSNLSQ